MTKYLIDKEYEDIICKCGGWIWTARHYYTDEDYIVELTCMKCNEKQLLTLVVQCNECCR